MTDRDRDGDPRDDATRARWADELVAAARAYWTPAREHATFGAKQLAITPSESGGSKPPGDPRGSVPQLSVGQSIAADFGHRLAVGSAFYV